MSYILVALLKSYGLTLQKHYEYRSSYSRDKIFALRELTPLENGSEMDPIIDYSRSAKSLFENIAMILLPSIALSLLSSSRHPHNRKMPSWVPDWTQNSHPNLFGSAYDSSETVSNQDFVHRPIKCSHAECDGMHRVLSVARVRYSCIVHLGAGFDFYKVEDASLQCSTTPCRDISPTRIPQGCSELQSRKRILLDSSNTAR